MSRSSSRIPLFFTVVTGTMLAEERTKRHLEDEQMSYTERHVHWMIDNNYNDHGNPWFE